MSGRPTNLDTGRTRASVQAVVAGVFFPSPLSYFFSFSLSLALEGDSID